MTASYLAIKDSGFSPEADRSGVALGTAYGSLLTNEMFYRDLLVHGPEGVSPFLFPYTIPSAATGEISIEFKIKGVNFTISSGWTAGLDAIGFASLTVKNGQTDAMLAGGVDAYGEILHKGLERLKTLSYSDEINPYKGTGFIPGEGGAFFMLEDFSKASARGAKIYAEVIGYGFSYDQDFEKAIIKSIRDSLKEADISPEKMEAVFLSANSTFIDKVELKAIDSVFGSDPELINLKPMLGETFGAHGPLSMAAALLGERKFSVVGILSLCYTKKSSFLILRRT